MDALCEKLFAKAGFRDRNSEGRRTGNKQMKSKSGCTLAPHLGGMLFLSLPAVLNFLVGCDKVGDWTSKNILHSLNDDVIMLATNV